MVTKNAKKIKVVDFIKKLEKIGFDNETELEFDTLDGSTGESYDLRLLKFIYGDDYCIPNVNVINVELDVDKEFMRAKSSETIEELAEELHSVLSKYRSERCC